MKKKSRAKKIRRSQYMAFTPFDLLSKKKRRSAWISLRWKLRKCSASTDNVVYSFFGLDEPGRPPQYNQQFSGYFLSPDGHTIYNAWFFTAADLFWSELNSQSYTAMTQLLGEEKINDRALSISFLREWIAERAQAYPELGGMTKAAFQEHWEREHVATADIAIHEEVYFEAGFQYGTGVYFMLDLPHLDKAAIKDAIIRFIDNGEQAWKNPAAIPRARLPAMTLNDTFSQYAYATQT